MMINLAQMRQLLSTLSLLGLATGCRPALLQVGQASAETGPVPTETAVPTATAIPATAIATATTTATPWPSPTAWPSPTPWPTATPWSAPRAWRPVRSIPPTVTPLPLVPALAMAGEAIPVNYAPPDGVDIFGTVMLRWDYFGLLAEDEFFDIKIKPAGSPDSAFVDWAKSPAYELKPWSGWTPGLYTWQIGIVKGHLEGDTKHFIADTGRDSQPFLLKWQAAGHGGGNGGSGDSGGGSNSSGGS